MSESWDEDGPANGKGSVRRARERAEKGVPFDGPHPIRQPPPVPAVFRSQDQGPRGPMISKPTPIPQWPLRDGDASRAEKSSSPETTRPPRGPPPQRPPRPGNVPSLLDSSRVHEYAPNMPARKPAQGPPTSGPPGNQLSNTRSPEESKLLSPSSMPDSTTSGTSERPSTNSSVGTIPDFPLPAAQVSQPLPVVPPLSTSARRSANLGPPPSARRGNSSFYSTSSYVSPIPEESPENPLRRDRSFASSKVMPSSWGSGPADSDIIGAYEHSRSSEDGSDSVPSIHGEDDGEVTLVRQASLGKRGKPALRTINKSGDHTPTDGGNGRPKTPDNKENSLQPPIPVPVGVHPAFAKETGFPPPMDEHPLNRQRSTSTSSDESSNYDLEKPPIALKPEPTLKELENEVLREDDTGRRQRKLETRRPPRLDLDAVRDAEARGSLTSLPDLIRRATRLATNLDRGKTASRLGIMDMLAQNGDQRKPGQRNSGSISDILASFPPPGAAGPSGDTRRGGPDQYQYDRGANSYSNFPENYDRQGKPRPKCCGIPRWLFVVICIALALIISAAVIIPIVLIVVPREAAENDARASVTPMSNSCGQVQPCQNGGVSVGTLDSCGCVCIDGFSGSECSVAADNSCATLDISDGPIDYSNATLGNALPRLFEAADANFSIPLNASAILKVFNTEDVSCTSENAVVTFNGSSRKRGLPTDLEDTAAIDINPSAKTPLPRPTLNSLRRHLRRQARHLVSRDQPLQKVDNPEPTRTTAVASNDPSPTSSSTPSDAPLPLSGHVVDFARIAVLFILEKTGDLEDATTAQDSIQSLFRRVSDGGGSTSDENDGGSDDHDDDVEGLGEPMDVECEKQQFSLDFARFTITLGNGTVVGGGGGG